MTAFRSVIRIVQSSAQRASQTLRVNNQQQQRNLANYAKPDTSALNEKQTQTLQQFKNAETHAKAVHEQRLMADIAGVPHTDATAYRRVAQRNWITAGLLMAFMGAVYSYSTNRIVTAGMILCCCYCDCEFDCCSAAVLLCSYFSLCLLLLC